MLTDEDKKVIESNKKYWATRSSKVQTKVTEMGIKATEEQLKKYYQGSMQRVIGQFEKTYNKVLSSIEEGKTPTPADLYKLDTYWKMQGQLKEELTKLGDKQAALLSKRFTEQYQNIYNSLAIPTSGAYSTISTESALQMINQIWCIDGKSWSERVWTNTDKLQQALNDNLIDCLLTGKKTTDLKNILQEQFGASYSRADALVRTEMAHIQTQAARDRYLDYGVQEVEIWADEDERRCEIRGKLHQKKYPIGAQVPIPAHPRCRCCIIPVVDEKDVEKLASAGYNEYEPCFLDNVDFSNNKDVESAIKKQDTIFVNIYEPTNLTELEEVEFGMNAEFIKPLEGYYDVKAHGTY